jgi:hypothetical protein
MRSLKLRFLCRTIDEHGGENRQPNAQRQALMKRHPSFANAQGTFRVTGHRNRLVAVSIAVIESAYN